MTGTVFELRITPRSTAVTITADPALESPCRVRSKGPKPTVREHDRELEIDYTIRGRLRAVASRSGSLRVDLNPASMWAIEIRGGVSQLRAGLQDLALQGIKISGGASEVVLDLPRPSGELVVDIAGGVSRAVLHRPAGVPVALDIEGGATDLRLDEEQLGAVGGPLRRRVPAEAGGDADLVVRISGGVSGLTIDSASEAAGSTAQGGG